MKSKLTQHTSHDMAVDIGQSIPSALVFERQSLVIDAEQME